jgi:hypothetical protein
MAIKYQIEKHNVAFPNKVASAKGGGHIFNVRVEEDVDNGTIGSLGAWNAFDEYLFKKGNAGFKGVIRDQAANGRWYVEVTEINAADPPIFLYNSPVVAESYNNDFKKESNFYNAEDDVVKGYELHLHDIIEESIEMFTSASQSKVAKNAVVTVSGKNLVAATS